jgi:hypothetical protein
MINVKISNRDILLLKDMHLSVFLSFYQVHSNHFQGLAKTTVYNRLSKLIRAGYIDTMRVNIVATHLNHLDIGVVYRPTKKGLQVISCYIDDEILRVDLAPINPACLYHDLLLTDTLRLLKSYFVDSKIVNTKLLKTSLKRNTQLPDAIIELPDRSERIALELELTMKSESRYRDIVTNYRTDSEFSKVTYLCHNKAITKKIGGIVTGFGSRFSLSDHSDEFFFTSVQDLFNDRHLKISNGRSLL